MPNIGHTMIVATGPQDSQRALLDHLRRAAPDGVTPTLSGLLAPDPVGDGFTAWIGLTSGEAGVRLSIGLKWDLDALKAAGHIAKRFPALRVAASYATEGALTAFRALGFVDGILAYDAGFEEDLACVVPFGTPAGQVRHVVGFFQRTASRTIAARDHIGTAGLGQLAAQAPLRGGWRRTHRDGPGMTAWLRPATASQPAVVLVALEHGAALLHGVDRHGGYERREDLAWRKATAACPDFDLEAGRAELRRVARVRRQAHIAACPTDPPVDGIPF